MNLRGNKRDKPFTIKLASGKEKSFQDGAAMHEWYMKNRPHQSRKKKRPSKGSKDKQ
jgi:hypothetical protein